MVNQKSSVRIGLVIMKGQISIVANALWLCEVPKNGEKQRLLKGFANKLNLLLLAVFLGFNLLLYFMKNLLHTLAGTWLIHSTNFPMWLKGDKTHPTFNYTVMTDKNGAEILLDEVKYQQKGKIKTITGYDYPDETDAMAFIWRGKGILGLVKSRWRIALLDTEKQWAVVVFESTLFTPSGMDIIGRKALSLDTLGAIMAMMKGDAALEPHLATLKTIMGTA